MHWPLKWRPYQSLHWEVKWRGGPRGPGQLYRFGFQFRMTVMGEALNCPTTDCITNDWASGETTYCCLYLRPAHSRPAHAAEDVGM
jgi:hypothetical protein